MDALTVSLNRFPSKVCPPNAGSRKEFLHQEAVRNVKKVPFHLPMSLFRHAIRSDDVDDFAKCLEMGDFVRDRSSPNSIALWAPGGIYELLELCLIWGAARCLQHLCHWCRDPAVPFEYDLRRLALLSRQCLIRFGRPACLLAMINAYSDEEELRAVHALCLISARSPDTVRKLAARFPPLHDRYPFLILACANPFVQPPLIEVLAEPFVYPNRLMETRTVASIWEPNPEDKTDQDARALATPLSTACAIRNLAAISTLLRLGADPFEPTQHRNPNLAYHPLLTAVTLSRDRASDPSASEPRFAAAMNATVSMLLAKMPEDFRASNSGREMLQRAAGRFLTGCRRILFAMVNANIALNGGLGQGRGNLRNLFDSNRAGRFVPGLTGHVALYCLRAGGVVMDEGFVATWALFLDNLPAWKAMAETAAGKVGPGEITMEGLFMGMLVGMDKVEVDKWEEECDAAEV